MPSPKTLRDVPPDAAGKPWRRWEDILQYSRAEGLRLVEKWRKQQEEKKK